SAEAAGLPDRIRPACAGTPSGRWPAGRPESGWTTCPYPLEPGSAGPGGRPLLREGAPETLSDRVIIAQYRRNLIIAGPGPILTVPTGRRTPHSRTACADRPGSAPSQD